MQTYFNIHWSLSYIRTIGMDGEAVLKAVLKEVHRTPFTVYQSLRDKGKGWTSRTKDSVKEDHGTYFTVHQSLRDKGMGWTSRSIGRSPQDILYCPLVFMDKGKGWTNRTKGSAKGFYRTSFTVHQSLRHKGMGWTSRTIGVHRTYFTLHQSFRIDGMDKHD